MAEGILAAITATETGVLISLTGQLEVSIPVTIAIDAVGVIVAGLSFVFAIESIKNLEADQANYRQSRIDESRSSDNLGSGTEGGSGTNAASRCGIDIRKDKKIADIRNFF